MQKQDAPEKQQPEKGLLTDLLQAPNLVSLSRICLLPPTAYFLYRSDDLSSLICIGLILIAGLTDGLDGYLARRLGQVSRLGVALDPIADKVFAGGLVILLVLFRDLPVWLAGIILGRDLLILILGSILLRGKDITLPSNLTGKYAFVAIVVLLGSYVIRFNFGIMLFVPLTLILLGASSYGYGRVFISVHNNQPAPVFEDKPAYRNTRIVVTSAISIIFLIKLFIHLIAL